MSAMRPELPAGPETAQQVGHARADTRRRGGGVRGATPLDLPRLVMRRAGLAALAVVLLALVLGLLRMGDDIEDEVDAAMTLASLMARLGSLAQTDDRSALEALRALRALQTEHPLRHLQLRVYSADGRLLMGPPPQPPEPPPLGWLLALHRELLSTPDARQVAWTVPRADGVRWTVSLAASHDSERREAMASLLDMLAMLLLCVAGVLLVMRWNVRRAFAPLGRLLEAITGIEGRDARAVQALPTMPIHELEVVAAALRHLGTALDTAEAQRRLLSQQVLTLQEDERARLARELHDEFGQRLTALRVDAAWLARQVADRPALKTVVDGMAAQCARVQQDIRALLTRLQPFGPRACGVAEGADGADGTERAEGAEGAADQTDAAGESLARLSALLRALVASWAPAGREGGTLVRLDLRWRAADGRPVPWPEGDVGEALWLPRPLLLTLYRISQEALTNVARHAQAQQAVISLCGRGGDHPGEPLRIDWAVEDDGLGLPSQGGVQFRGNGLAGIQERVWALGGQWHRAAARPGTLRPGLRLAAGFSSRRLAAPQAPV